eukprot:1184640-Prorocentrum_minimum.AAC.3
MASCVVVAEEVRVEVNQGTRKGNSFESVLKFKVQSDQNQIQPRPLSPPPRTSEALGDAL